MTLDDLAGKVSERTNRPDLTSVIRDAVKQATLKLHSLDFFTKDLRIVTLSVTPLTEGDTRYAIDTYALPFERFRAARNVMEYNTPPTGQEVVLDAMEFGALQDSYGIEVGNYWLFNGAGLSLRAPKALSNVQISYYQYPDINDGSFTSWIARELPYVIIDEASAIVFKRIGKDEEATIYKNVIQENLVLLRTSGGIPGVAI